MFKSKPLLFNGALWNIIKRSTGSSWKTRPNHTEKHEDLPKLVNIWWQARITNDKI